MGVRLPRTVDNPVREAQPFYPVDPVTGAPADAGGAPGTSNTTESTQLLVREALGAVDDPAWDGLDDEANLIEIGKATHDQIAASADQEGELDDEPWAGTGVPASRIALDKALVLAAMNTNPVPVVGYLSTVAVTPAVLATPDYAAGYTVGGIMTFAALLRADAKTAYAVALRVTAKIATTTQIDAFIFNASPAGSTTTDGAAFVLADADRAKLKGVIKLEAADWTAAGAAASVGYKEGRVPLTGAAADDIFVVLVARGVINMGTTGDLVAELTVDQN